MNKKQWTGLLMVYISYLLLGATIFYFIEAEAEEHDRDVKYSEYEQLTDIIREKFGDDDEGQKDFVGKLNEYCSKTFDFNKSKDEVVPRVWNFYTSFFFVVTVVSTIGYGNLHPTTDLGRVLMIFYAIIGIPLNGILLTSLGQFFGAVFLRAHSKYKSRRRYGAKCTLAVNILTYLTPGLIIFIFLPAGLFCVFENDWDYIEAVYFAFVTLTTIGFGDFVAGQQSPDETGPGLMAYKFLLVCWVIFGLGYLIMLLSFVARAMQAKKIVQLEEKFLAQITHSKLWHGFVKDVGYVRRLINETYLDKLKPVFRDDRAFPPPKIHRSKSLPDIFADDDSVMKRLRHRQRAMSEYAPNKITLNRVFSETDLTRIDRNATFAGAAALPTTFELMQKFIDVYSVNQWSSSDDDEEQGGIEIFSDDEVLASETWNEKPPNMAPTSRHPSSIFNVPSYEDTLSRQPHRGRAMSECPPPEINLVSSEPNPTSPVDWTWSGPNANKLHDIIKQRNKQRMLMGLNKGRKPSLSASALATVKKITGRRRCVTETNSDETNIDDHSQETVSKNNLTVPGLSAKRRSLQETRDIRRGSQFLNVPDRHNRPGAYARHDSTRRIEDMSVADFLRVLTTLQLQVGERLVTSDQQTKPKRKMGTASLTPPRIRSLLELFSDPSVRNSPKMPPKRRKPSRITNIFRNDSKKESMPNLPTSDEAAKSPEPSNLKRFGRFLLRSYTTKDAEDVTRTPFRGFKRFSLWPADSDDKDSPPFQPQIDSPSEISKASTEVTITIEPEESGAVSRSQPFVIVTMPDEPQNEDQPKPVRKSSKTHWLLDDPPSDTKGGSC